MASAYGVDSFQTAAKGGESQGGAPQSPRVRKTKHPRKARHLVCGADRVPERKSCIERTL